MKIIIPIKVLKLQDGVHLLVQLRVNGKTASLVLDTGASHTVFDRTQIKKFIQEENFESHDNLSVGLGTNDMKSHLIVLDNIQIGKLEIRKKKSVVIDLSHLNIAYEKMNKKPVDGVLGSDILQKYRAVIDYGKRVVVLSK
ncbi:MAG TPA: retropepsin-like aspartic protease [Bacteroidia bacterium]